MLRCAFRACALWLLLIGCGGHPSASSAPEDATGTTAADAGDAGACVVHLATSPTALVWDAAPVGQIQKQWVNLQSMGTCPVTITAIQFLTSNFGLTIDALGGLSSIAGDVSAITLPQPIVLLPGQALAVTLSAQPVSVNPIHGELRLLSDDPATPDGTLITLDVNPNAACLKVTPPQIAFAPMPAGVSVQSRDVSLAVTGGGAACISHVALKNVIALPGEFALDFQAMQGVCAGIDAKTGPSPAHPCCLPAGTQTVVTVHYAPLDESLPNDPQNPASPPQEDTATLEVTTDAAACPVPGVKLSGIGLNGACPVTQFAIAEGNEVVPWTTVHLDASGSIGTGGLAVAQYAWSVQEPAGGAVNALVMTGLDKPVVSLPAVGAYKFCLTITDEGGHTSCQPACQDVLVVPVEAVYVQLTWDTPADPDQTDGGAAAGADMDLHLANYLASGPDLDCDGTGDPWFNIPFDCFWFNGQPQWGSPNTAIQDDPTMDIDDTDGMGPEYVRLPHPEGTPDLPRWYAIGVHYWNDHGYGASTATVQVFLFGAQALQLEPIAMNPLDLWHVGKVNWPNQLTGTSTPPLTVCYQSGDTCSGDGAMWQDKGDWCITPCYFNPAFKSSKDTGGPGNTCGGKP